MSDSGIGTPVRVGRFAGCVGQHTLASDDVQFDGFPRREHVLVRSTRVNGPTRYIDAWIPLEHVELIE